MTDRPPAAAPVPASADASSTASAPPAGATVRPVRFQSPEEIVAHEGGVPDAVRWADPASVYRQRAIRLRQLAAGHPMRDYLMFVAQLVEAQQALVDGILDDGDLDDGVVGDDGIDTARLAAGPGWLRALDALLDAVGQDPPGDGVLRAVGALRATAPDALQRQGARLLAEAGDGVDTASAPFLAAALQVTALRHAQAIRRQAQAVSNDGRAAVMPRRDGGLRCPCCASRPTASVVVIGGDDAGSRHLSCSLCDTQWHFVRIRCAGCGSTEKIEYHGLAAVEGTPAAAAPAVQIECCGVCGHYLKIVNRTRDPEVEPVADDLGTLSLDILGAQAGWQRHGRNLLLLLGPPD